MRYPGYYHERPSRGVENTFARHNNSGHKIDVWNTFIDSDLTDIVDDDFSIIPRALPMSYWPTLYRTAYLVTEFCMRLISLPEREIRAIVPKGPIRDHLLNELKVVKYRTGRITGSFRYDMAVVGPPDRHHPPHLLEINEIGFDGLARSSYFQRALLQLMPELRKRVKSLDTAAIEVRNMQRLGSRIARIQYDSYNWDEEYLVRTAQGMGAELKLICPRQFKLKVDHDFPMLEYKTIGFSKNSVTIDGWRPDAVNMSFAYDMDDYRKGHAIYSRLVRSRTPQYGPFLTGFVASKTILVLLADPLLRKKLLGSAKTLSHSILPAHLLSDASSKESLRQPADWVLKHCDGFGGEQVFMDRDLERRIKRIPARLRHEWVLQKKTQLNLIDVNGILSRPKKAISDLGVFVQYDWANGRFRNFQIGGLMCRATNRSLKVNVSSGGLQVAVFLDRAK